MHSYIDPTISHPFKMAVRTCRRLCKSYGLSSTLNLSGSTPFRFISLLEDLEELLTPLILPGNPIPILDAFFTIPSITKYTQKNLQRILKMVLDVQAFAPAHITFLEGPQEHRLKAYFSYAYHRRNHLDCYNFCQ